MTKLYTMEEILEYFEENNEALIDTIEALDDYNGYLDEGRWYDMDEFDSMFSHLSPSEVLSMVDTDFNINDYYFKDGCYGVISADERDYSDYCDRNFVENLLEEWTNIQDSLPAKVKNMLANYDDGKPVEQTILWHRGVPEAEGMYLCKFEFDHYQYLNYCDGWNTGKTEDGIDRTSEISADLIEMWASMKEGE